MKHLPSRPEVVNGIFCPERMNAEHVYIKIAPQDINAVNRILEGYEYIGVLTTVVPGIAVVQTTMDTKEIAIKILKTVPEVVELLNSSFPCQ